MREPAGSRPPGILILPPPRLTFSNIVDRSRLWIGGILLGAALCLAPACGDDDEPLPDVPVRPTPEPEPTPTDTTTLRCLAIRADWSEALAEATIPGTYRLRIGEESLTADARILYMYSDSIAEGPYALLAYNKPEGITLADSLARIDRTEDGQLTTLPGYLFAADTTVTVATGDTADVTLAMRRLVHPITLTLRFSKPAEVARMEATLSGLITAIRLPDGEPVEVTPLRAADDGLTALACDTLACGEGVRLRSRSFGIVRDDRQWLEASIALSDGRTLALRVDLSEALADFAHLAPVSLENTIDIPEPEPTPDPDPEPTPEPEPEPEVVIDISSTITDWLPGGGGSGSAT